ncbi:MAG TPA: hypothetical protein VGL57_14525 [Solirubrobacteraceae bacterium]
MYAQFRQTTSPKEEYMHQWKHSRGSQGRFRQEAGARGAAQAISRVTPAVVLAGLLALLVAVLAFAVGPARALASPPEWRLDGAVLGETVITPWKGKVKLSNKELGTSVECEENAEGLVKLGYEGKVETMTMSKCVGLKTCESGSTLTALGLPWRTELAVVEGVTRDVVKNALEHPVGYSISCNTALGKLTEECTATELDTTTANGAGGVTATFLASQKLKCGTRVGAGVLEGAQAVGASEGGKLSAVNAAEVAKLSEPEWRHLGSPLLGSEGVVGFNGKVKLSNSELGTTVECAESTFEGSVVPRDTGKFTLVNPARCVGVGSVCSGSAVATAVHLPWNGELISLEGSTHYVITNGGGGEPGYAFSCKTTAGEVKEECFRPALNTTTTERGGVEVIATFAGDEKMRCNGRLGVGTLEGSQGFQLRGGGQLET